MPPLSGQAWMVLLALGPQTVGWLLIAHGVVRLRAFAVSLLLTVQPVLTTIWGILAFGEDDASAAGRGRGPRARRRARRAARRHRRARTPPRRPLTPSRRPPNVDGDGPSGCARHESNVRPQPPQGCALSPELRAPCGHSTSVPSRNAPSPGVERDERRAVLDRAAHVAERGRAALRHRSDARQASHLALAVEQRRGQDGQPRRAAGGAARGWHARGEPGARSAPGRCSSPS